MADEWDKRATEVLPEMHAVPHRTQLRALVATELRRAEQAGFARGAESILHRLADARADGIEIGLEMAEHAADTCEPAAPSAIWSGCRGSIVERIRALRTTPGEPVRSYEDGVREGLQSAHVRGPNGQTICLLVLGEDAEVPRG